MHHLIKIMLIVTMFVPLICYVAQLLAANGNALNLLRLGIAEQMFLAIFFLLPTLVLRQMRVFRRMNDIPSEFD